MARSSSQAATNTETPSHRRQAWSVLVASTLGFTVCFMVWMMFGVIGIP
ncbi:MAG: MFS transporter, partial [Casimicrobiaceae bacterium]